MVLFKPIVPSAVAPYWPVQLANTFIGRYGANSKIDHLKLQKLCYFSYGWWLSLSGSTLPIISARPQVWKLGPVFQPIYGVFAGFRGQAITSPQPLGPFSPAAIIDKNTDQPSQLVDWIWGKYGSFSGVELSDMTHESDTPWFQIAKAHKFVVPRYMEIQDDENRAYFDRLARKEGFIQ